MLASFPATQSLDERAPTRRSTVEKRKPVKIELTEEQKKQIRQATGKDASAIELTVEELEERVSPGKGFSPTSQA